MQNFEFFISDIVFVFCNISGKKKEIDDLQTYLMLRSPGISRFQVTFETKRRSMRNIKLWGGGNRVIIFTYLQDILPGLIDRAK